MKVSIIIPTKNGEQYLEECLEMVFKQKAVFTNEESKENAHFPFDYEVIVIDSGSIDRTLEIIKKFPQIKLSHIPPKEYSHGGTRDRAVKTAKGEFLVFIVQDATPVDENWLSNLIGTFELNPKIAGVFGRHLPRLNCNPFERRDINNHFAAFGEEVVLYQVEPGKEGMEKYEVNKHVMNFFSNVNSAIRRDIWEKIPFGDVYMGEDQFWAKKILLDGYIKAYQPNAAVYHSHNYHPFKWFKRWFDEFRQHKQNQNYVGVSSAWKIFPLTLRLWLNDIRYIRDEKDYNFWRKIYWSGWSFFVDLSRILAEYLGGRYEKLPKWLQNKLSMQYQLINKK